jgi:type I restriction enzyme R subunit
MTTDTSEAGLEAVIVRQMTEPEVGWSEGDPADFDREFALDVEQLASFLQATQPAIAEAADLRGEGATRRRLLARLQGEITSRGIVDVLRNGIKHGPLSVDLLYGTPSPGNATAAERYAANRFVVTRQLRYSRDETRLALDLVLFVNGLPIATFELKNNLTKQTVEDAVEQYKRDRSPRELIFGFGRCLAHFAVDEAEVRFCTRLEEGRSWFLPFNRGYNGGAGNPPNPEGLKTDYLWRQVLARDSLTEIIEKFAARLTTRDPRSGTKSSRQIFPRYHQLDAVRKLLADAGAQGAGRRYLIQHSAGSGKSNSIAWLAHGLIELENEGGATFDSVIVITDRRVLDQQIEATIRQFSQVGATVGHAQRSGDLRGLIESGKRIIISTVQKFPFILDDIGSAHADRSFAILIDEAHSSQGGETAKAMSQALSGVASAGSEEESYEDKVNRVIESRKMLSNASYFAFTATPKNKTLEIFGEPYQEDGETKHRPFHTYTMKQAIEERFIVDVLANYTSVASYYRLITTIDEDPLFDTRRANHKLRAYVEGNEHAIGVKAQIMVDHFHDEVLGPRKVGGHARGMVVTGDIQRTIEYFHAIKAYLRERRSGIEAIVAFSGEHDYRGHRVTEASLNDFPSSQIVDRIREDPFRLLVCADKFQTGYDEPLLHTMYVDKVLSGVQAVQTLSRLNRAHPDKYDAFVLDFVNDADTIADSFSPYYRTTILSEETDPDKLHDLHAALYEAEVFGNAEVREVARLFLDAAPREQLDIVLDTCVATYNERLDEAGQVAFKGSAKAFVRSYGFLGAILPYGNPEWEELSIFLNLLIPKLPAPQEEDLSRGILEAVDMDSYRAEKRQTIALALVDEDVEIDPVPAGGEGGRPEPELDRLSTIVKAFNDLFGDVEWQDRDRVLRDVAELPAKVAADPAYRNAMLHSDRQNARIEHDQALSRVVRSMLHDNTEFFKLFSDNPEFKRWITDISFGESYEPGIGALDERVEDIELGLRGLVSKVLEGDVEKLPQHVQGKVRERIAGALNKQPGLDQAYFETMAGLLEYCDLRELQDTISNKGLWPLFEGSFASREMLARRFDQLAELRNSVRHSRSPSEVTRREGEAAIRWFEEVLAAAWPSDGTSFEAIQQRINAVPMTGEEFNRHFGSLPADDEG